MIITPVTIILFKPFMVGVIYYILHIIRFNNKVTIIEFLLTFTLIYQVANLIEIFINSFTYYTSLSDFKLWLSDNNNINTNDNITRNRDYPDYTRLIRDFCTNIAALIAQRPIFRAIVFTISNAGHIMSDIVSSEEKANYWIDQYNFFMKTDRLIDGQDETGPFERGTNLFYNQGGTENTKGLGDTSNFTSNFDFIRELLSPVDHSIPLGTLINIHLVMHLGLFVMVISLIMITIFLYINLIILFNKDYFLNKVKNKYVLMYVKYVAFTTRIDIFFVSFIILSLQCFMAYILHYLIIHPIIIK